MNSGFGDYFAGISFCLILGITVGLCLIAVLLSEKGSCSVPGSSN